MKKILFTALIAIGMIGSSAAQMAIPGEVFASNPAKFNGRQVTIKNLDFIKGSPQVGPSIGGPAGTFSNVAPGPAGTPTAPTTTPCRPPRGYSEINISFRGYPEYKGCFFMLDAMKAELERQCGHDKTPIQITLRGDNRMGYNVSFYRLGM